MLVNLLALTLTLAPSLVSAALFPPDSLVKKLEAKDFKKVMKENSTSVVAFVAPWCGHCQRMVPELSKAALGLYPLIPTYAVDCDDAKNRPLCAEQGVQGFPTVKLFPRGKDMKPVLFDGPQRTASAFYYWAIRRIPHKNKKLYHVEDVEPWVNAVRLGNPEKHRVLLLSKSKGVPLLWQVLANKYRDQLTFANHRDRKGKSSVKLGYEAGTKKESKVLVYPAGSTKPVLFQGILKYDSLSKFFDSVLDGTADLTVLNEAAKEEEYELSPEEEEIERQQEAQRLALAHGGFTEMIDFEEAVKQYGTDFHDSHGYGGMMGDMPKKKDKAGAKEGTEEKKAKKEEDPIHRILKVQKEKAEKKAKEQGQMPATGDGAQVVMEAQTDVDAPHQATATAKTTESKPTPTIEVVEEAAEEEGNDAEEDVAAEELVSEPLEATKEDPVIPKSGHVADEL
ncbi:hypothetical protein OF83DRAFT_1190790 [Amylostereum chailletii]|nr:hypothetical protein OF83DRAFT_1190790 [Amylostereum chailletii]